MPYKDLIGLDKYEVTYKECLMLVDFYTEGRHPEWCKLRELDDELKKPNLEAHIHKVLMMSKNLKVTHLINVEQAIVKLNNELRGKHSSDIKLQYEKYASSVDKKQLRNIKENVREDIILAKLSKNSRVLQFWADVAHREEDDKSSKNIHNLMNFASGRFLLELKLCDDLVQLDDFKKLVNNMIEEHRKVIIQKTQEAHKKAIIQKWKEIAGNSSLFFSNSFVIFEDKFIQKNLLDSFYCMTIDLFCDSDLWRNVLGTNFTRFKISKFESVNLKNIFEINNTVKDSFENFNLQNINELQNPDISIEYFLSLNLKLSEGVYSERVKGSIIEILNLWIITWKKDEEIDEKDYVHRFIISPLEKLLGINLLRYITLHGLEHPTYCLYERKSFFFNFDDLEASSCQVFDQLVNNEDFNNPEIYSKGIMSKKKYCKKVDITISYRVENMINNRVQYGYFYPILGEAKFPNINGDNNYNKLSRALNDNFNIIINYYSKKVKGISDDLLDLFSDIKLGKIHVTDGEIYLLQYTRYPNQKFGVLADISSSKIPLKFEDQQAGYMIDFLYCVK
ncbi:15706_t:CDS:10, partial [Dentiscutata erythropus]